MRASITKRIGLIGGTITEFDTLFPVAENPLVEDGEWLGGASYFGSWQNIRSVSGGRTAGLNASDADYDDCFAIRKRPAPGQALFSPNQWIEGTVYVESGFVPGNSQENQLILRCDGSSGSIKLIEINWPIDNSNIQLVRWIGALNSIDVSVSLLGNGPQRTPVTGDKVLAVISGDVLGIKLNGTNIYSCTINSSFLTQVGMGPMHFWRTGADPLKSGWSRIRMGSGSGPSS